MVEASRIRVMCVDRRLVCEGIARILERETDIEVVACATSGEESLRLFNAYHPDVTLMELCLKDMSGADAIRRIRHMSADARVIVVTASDGEENIRHALDAGAVSYMLKDADSSDLLRVVREVHADARAAGHGSRARAAAPEPVRALTPRELQVIELVAQGMRNREIAVALDISQDTAHVHLRNIMTKLHVKDRTAAVGVWLRRGVMPLSSRQR
jgi:DNA-binding NarL/FixJ family response regulator